MGGDVNGALNFNGDELEKFNKRINFDIQKTNKQTRVSEVVEDTHT